MEMIRYILEECKINPNTKSNDGDTCLTIACFIKHTNLELIKLLISFKADPNIKNKQGNSPLHLSMLQNPEKPENTKVNKKKNLLLI
jgi:ankyrin repeat protein